MKIKGLAGLSACIGVAIALSAAPAGATSLTGTFVTDDAQFSTTFAVAGTFDAIATIRSFSYAGGINGIGQTVPRGGFDPVVSLFNASGQLVGLSDDGIGVPLDIVSGQGADSLLTLRLVPGLYQLVLTQYDNFPNGDLAAGFSRAGQGNFTAGTAGCSANRFCDAYGFARTGNWALDITVSPVPEPSAAALAMVGLGGLGAMALRRRRAERQPMRSAT